MIWENVVDHPVDVSGLSNADLIIRKEENEIWLPDSIPFVDPKEKGDLDDIKTNDFHEEKLEKLGKATTINNNKHSNFQAKDEEQVLIADRNSTVSNICKYCSLSKDNINYCHQGKGCQIASNLLKNRDDITPVNKIDLTNKNLNDQHNRNELRFNISK